MLLFVLNVFIDSNNDLFNRIAPILFLYGDVGSALNKHTHSHSSQTDCPAFLNAISIVCCHF